MKGTLQNHQYWRFALLTAVYLQMKWTLWRRWSTPRPGWPAWRSPMSSFASMLPSWGAGEQLSEPSPASRPFLRSKGSRDHYGLHSMKTKMSNLFMRRRWAAYFTWVKSLDDPTYVAGTCHPWAVHRTQNKHTSRKYLCSSFLVLWFAIAIIDALTWPQPGAAPWTETETDSLSTKWKSTREVFTTTLITTTNTTTNTTTTTTTSLESNSATRRIFLIVAFAFQIFLILSNYFHHSLFAFQPFLPL